MNNEKVDQKKVDKDMNINETKNDQQKKSDEKYKVIITTITTISSYH